MRVSGDIFNRLGPRRRQVAEAAVAIVVMLLCSCSATKFVPNGEHLLAKVELKADQKGFNAAPLMPYVQQKANSKWFSLFKIPLGIYALSGRDTSRWVNRVLQNIGERPVIYNAQQAQNSCADLQATLQGMGYMSGWAELKTKTKGKRLKAVYVLHPGERYHIGSVGYDIQDSSIARILRTDDTKYQGLKTGEPFTLARLEEERSRIVRILADSGYFRFHKDFIMYGADSVSGTREVDLMLHLLRYRAEGSTHEEPHPRYTVNSVNFLSNDSNKVHLRPRVLRRSTAIRVGAPFSASDLQRTYNNFARMQAVRYTHIKFRQQPDTTLLDCDITISTNKPSSISFQPEGTNTAGDLGAAASVTYENRNLFRGSLRGNNRFRGLSEQRLPGIWRRNQVGVSTFFSSFPVASVQATQCGYIRGIGKLEPSKPPRVSSTSLFHSLALPLERTQTPHRLPFRPFRPQLCVYALDQ